MRCATHGLAAGPDGACVLCRSGGKRAKAGSNAPLVALVAAVLLVGVTAAAFRFLGERPGLPDRERAASTLARATPAPAPQVEESSQAPAVASPPPPEPSFPVAPVPTPAPIVEAPLAAASASSPTLASAEPPPRARSDAEITAALRATPIVMFSTTWCGVCRRARAFLDANELSYTERDVDRDAAAHAELKRLTGETSVPAFLVDGKLVGRGFSEGSLKRALLASVERRLGVKAELRNR